VSERTLGDVEFVVVHLDSGHLGPMVLEALLLQVESGAVRLLDLVIVHHVASDEYHLTEVDIDEFALAGLRMHTPGLVSEDDVRHFAAGLPLGAAAALILVEPTWSERFSRDVGRRGARVLARQPIPAAVANTVLAAVPQQQGQRSH